MSYEISTNLDTHTEARPRQLKRLVDRLVSLADYSDEIDVTERAAEIIDEIKETSKAVHQLSQLEDLASLSANNPDEPLLHEIIDDTAEYLLKEIEEAAPSEISNIGNLSSVWAAIKTWDVNRSTPTAKLCVKVLNNFPGVAQPRLVEAYVHARDHHISFDDALDIVNQAA